MKPNFFLDTERQRERYLLHNNSTDDLKYKEYFMKIINKIEELLSHENVSLFDFTSFFDYGSGPEPCFITLLEEMKSSGQIPENASIQGWDPIFNDFVCKKENDIVFCIEVIEHFEEPQENLKNLVSFCKKNGFIVIKTGYIPNSCDLSVDSELFFENWWYRQDSTHVAFYTKNALIAFMKTQGCLFISDNKDITIFKKIENN